MYTAHVWPPTAKEEHTSAARLIAAYAFGEFYDQPDLALRNQLTVFPKHRRRTGTLYRVHPAHEQSESEYTVSQSRTHEHHAYACK